MTPDDADPVAAPPTAGSFAQLGPDAASRQLSAIMGASDDCIFAKTLDGQVLSWNPGAQRLYGYTPEEMVGRSVTTLVPPDRPDEVPEILARLRAGQRIDHLETVRVTKDGRRVPVSLSISPISDADGRVVAAATIARDISDQVRAREESERIQGILDAASDAFVGMDQDGLVTDWNRAAEELFGWSADEAVGRRLSETIIPARYREAHERGRRHYLDTGEGPVVGQRVQLEALHRDGHEFPVELSVFVTTASGTPHFNAFVRDVSEHRRLMAELEAARDRALEASRLKSEFLATMSHEIRTPMNGVIGMAGLLLDTELDPEQREYAEIVRNSGDALLTIINDILDFSKVEAGHLDLEVVDFDLRDLVEEVADLLAPHAHAKGLELATLVRPEVPALVRSDPGRLRQILLNLLNNAVKFTDSGEVVVRATVSDETARDAAIVFQVSDTGIGIDPADLDRMFDPFSQADSSTTRTYGGTGLGLAICKRLVELLGGKITVDSEPGRGSTFAFTVRVEKQLDAAPAAAARCDLAGLRVLIVDDNATNRMILEHQVRGWGMTSTSAHDASTALERLADAHTSGVPYDVALLDMDMPGMDGIELTHAIRRRPDAAGLPIVLLTSSGVRGSAAAASRAGVSAYLTKPVHQAQLFDVITTVLGTERPSAPVTHAAVAEAKAQARPVVLVVEDNPANQKVATAMLKKIGYRADVVGNGLEAVEVVGRIPYGAVLMDCQMPVMDGYTATAAIRAAEPDGARIPIIAMTAAATTGEEERCLAAGMDDYVPKPVMMEQLRETLARWIETEADTGA